MRRQRRLDLAQLDAEAADLDLVVDAAEELDVAVRAASGQVAGAVEARARRAGERVGHEALGGQLGPVEVAAGEAARRRCKLARHARPAPARRAAVQDVDAACWRSAGRWAPRGPRRVLAPACQVAKIVASVGP